MPKLMPLSEKLADACNMMKEFTKKSQTALHCLEEQKQPVYYEKVLKGKNTRDDESAEMLDLIFNNISFDFCQIYSYAFGDQKAPTMLMRQTIKKDTEIASTYEADKQLYEDTIASLIDALK